MSEPILPARALAAECGARSKSVVTGIGVTAPNGVGTDLWWAATLAGKSGIDRIDRFDAADYRVKLAGEVRGFDPVQYVPGKLIAQTDRMTQFALAGAQMALSDAGIDPAQLAEYEMAVVTADSSGGAEYGQRELQRLWQDGPLAVRAYMAIAWFYAASTGQISIRYGMRGPCGVLASEGAGGVNAITHARRLLRIADASLVLTGGTDASLSPSGLVAQMASLRLSGQADPAEAYLPFASGARGHLPGEGGAMLVVEDIGTARARGATCYGEIAGCASTFDAAPETRGPTLRRCIEAALADAELDPAEIDVVFADGAADPAADLVEARALNEIFGPGGVPVTVPKSMTGRMYAGAAVVDVAAALLSIRDQLLPPTINVRRCAPEYQLDLVLDEPRSATVRTALVVARGYGGFNGATVVRAVD